MVTFELLDFFKKSYIEVFYNTQKEKFEKVEETFFIFLIFLLILCAIIFGMDYLFQKLTTMLYSNKI